MLGKAMLIQIPVGISRKYNDRARPIDEVFMDWTDTVRSVRCVKQSSVALSSKRTTQFFEDSFSAHD